MVDYHKVKIMASRSWIERNMHDVIEVVKDNLPECKLYDLGQNEMWLTI